MLIANRYVLTGEPVREGGMSTVQKAFDPQQNRFCAIKRMKLAQEYDLRWKESFNREQNALSDLSGHPNVVELYDVGSDENGFYMVLEWVPENLYDAVKQTGPIEWASFYTKIGRPILEALAFVQSRGWVHRDIKPQNILLTDDNVPKIADLGIAKQYEKPVLGLTFGAFRSVPFTPPEHDSGQWICSRDCFSWSALTVFCLTGKNPADYGELKTLAAGLDSSTVPIQVLEEALSQNPAERPPLASALLAELDTFWARFEAANQQIGDCHVQFDPSCLNSVMRALDAGDRREVERAIAEELNDVACGFRSLDTKGDKDRGLRIFAVSWIFEGALAPSSGRLRIKKAWRSKAAEIERHRESAFRIRLMFSL